MQPHDDVIAIGSGGNYALAAARALLEAQTNMSAEEVARLSMKVAADLCIYTNHNFTMEKLVKAPQQLDSKPADPTKEGNLDGLPEQSNDPSSDGNSKE